MLRVLELANNTLLRKKCMKMRIKLYRESCPWHAMVDFRARSKLRYETRCTEEKISNAGVKITPQDDLLFCAKFYRTKTAATSIM